MQSLEVSGAVGHLCGSLGFKGLKTGIVLTSLTRFKAMCTNEEK